MRQEFAFGIIALIAVLGMLIAWKRSRPRRPRHVRINLFKGE